MFRNSTEWYIELSSDITGNPGSQRAELFRALGASDVGDVGPIKQRKYLLMNSLHLGIAVLAMHKGSKTLGKYMSSRRGSGKLEGLSQELASVLALRYPSESHAAISVWREQYLQRIRDNPADTPDRILSRLCAPTTSSYLVDGTDKLFKPADEYKANMDYEAMFLDMAKEAFLEVRRKARNRRRSADRKAQRQRRRELKAPQLRHYQDQ